MGKPKHVGDTAMVTDIGDGMLVVGKPTVAMNPVTGQMEDVVTVIITDTPTYCPSCKEQNDPGIEITVLKSMICAYACKKCNQYAWFKPKENTGEEEGIQK